MKIGTIGAASYAAVAASHVSRKDAPETTETSVADSVAISELSRARLAKLADTALAKEKIEIQQAQEERRQKLDDVREKIARGYYNSPDVLRKIAERITDNNDENL